MNVGHCRIGARLVRRPAELASSNHALDGQGRAHERARDVDWRTRELARENIIAEECGAVVLGDHVKVPARELSVRKPAPSCTQTTCHGSLRWLANTLGSDPLVGPGSTGGSGAWQSDVGCADQNEERGEETGGETDPETREPAHSQRKSGRVANSAVDWAEASKQAICIKGRRRLNTRK